MSLQFLYMYQQRKRLPNFETNAKVRITLEDAVVSSTKRVFFFFFYDFIHLRLLISTFILTNQSFFFCNNLT